MAEQTILYKSKCISIPRNGEVVEGEAVKSTFIEGSTTIPDGQFFIVASSQQLKYVPASTFYQKTEDKIVGKINADCGVIIVAE